MVQAQENLSKPNEFEPNQTDEFLKLAGSWKDEREAEEIVGEIRRSRNNSDRFGKENELFD